MSPVDDIPCANKGCAHDCEEDDEEEEVQACLGKGEPHDWEAPVEGKEPENVKNTNHNRYKMKIKFKKKIKKLKLY